MILQYFSEKNIRFSDSDTGCEYEFRLTSASTAQVFLWLTPGYSLTYTEKLDAAVDAEVLNLITETHDADGMPHFSLALVECWNMAYGLREALTAEDDAQTHENGVYITGEMRS